jgi:raffinose/stachyose/melibiose transport system permease protein
MSTIPNRKTSDYVILAASILLGLLFIYPVFYAFLSAFKTNGEILKNPVALPKNFFYFKNFVDLFKMSKFSGAIVNSVLLTGISEAIIILIIPLAAFAIARNPGKVSTAMYSFFLVGMMIPFHLYMFPLFKQLKMFGLFGNIWGPIVCYISGSVPFGILLYCGFLKGIPLDIEEAATIDGCNKFQIFWKITFRLLGPCNASMIILNGLNIWNDFLMPFLVLPGTKPKTITVQIASFVGLYTARWDMVFAGTIISMLPAIVIFMMFQKYFVKGITAGAAKG